MSVYEALALMINSGILLLGLLLILVRKNKTVKPLFQTLTTK